MLLTLKVVIAKIYLLYYDICIKALITVVNLALHSNVSAWLRLVTWVIFNKSAFL